MDIQDRAVRILSSLGVSDINTELLEHVVELVIAKVTGYCNIQYVPKKAEPLLINAICGYYLRNAKSFGMLGSEFEFDAVVKSISEGDTSVTFALNDAGMTAEERFDYAVNKMCEIDMSSFKKYRRLKW